jgi:hypothetical protein
MWLPKIRSNLQPMSSGLNTEAVFPSEMLVSTYQIIRCYKPVSSPSWLPNTRTTIAIF